MLIISLLLITATVAVYGQVIRFDFVTYDDPEYVTQNANIRAGLTTDGFIWAFTSRHHATWHPLTGLSHMLDCELYGLNPAGHHATNVLLHVLNTVVLFFMLASATRAVWQSAFVAALFALHPLHVESVAWIAERKDVLSTLFGLLSMWAYVTYARRGGTGRYLLTAILLALGLMAKPMLVTLPLVYLLLDYWPLERIRIGRHGEARPGEASAAQGSRQPNDQRPPITQLLLEKIPLLALSVATSLATMFVQRSARAIRDAVPLDLALSNALMSYVRYLGKTLWPSNLSALYPHPNLPGGTPWENWQVAGAGLVLLVISVLALRATSRRYAIVGWLWYVGTLVPVIGLVQAGEQAMADRYTYVPLIGLFIIVAWGSADLAAAWPIPRQAARMAMQLAAAMVVAAAMACTWRQVGYWRNSASLFQHAVSAVPRSAVMHYHLGTVFLEQGKLDDALREYNHALEIQPDYARVHYNLGNMLHKAGKIDEAIDHYRQAVRAQPDYASAHVNLGVMLRGQGKVDEAIYHLREAVRLRPDWSLPHTNLGSALESKGSFEEAIHQYREALGINPGSARAHQNLARALQSQGKPDEAQEHIRAAKRLGAK